LSKTEINPRGTIVHWQVSGLPAGYAPGEGMDGEFSLLLPDGEMLKAVGAEGGATGIGATGVGATGVGATGVGATGVAGAAPAAGETGEVTFPALPDGTRSFTLIIPNGWGGKNETWHVPVMLP